MIIANILHIFLPMIAYLGVLDVYCMQKNSNTSDSLFKKIESSLKVNPCLIKASTYNSKTFPYSLRGIIGAQDIFFMSSVKGSDNQMYDYADTFMRGICIIQGKESVMVVVKGAECAVKEASERHILPGNKSSAAKVMFLWNGFFMGVLVGLVLPLFGQYDIVKTLGKEK